LKPVIPPAPSDKDKESDEQDKKGFDSDKGSDLEKGFIRPDQDLPGFEEHELGGKNRADEPSEKHELSGEDKGPEGGIGGLSFDVVHKIIRVTCLISLIVWFIIIISLSIITRSDPFNTLVGLSPVLLTIIVTYILVDKYHLESGFLMVFPLIFTAILFVLGVAGLLKSIDYKTLSSVNIIFGLLFEAAIIIHYSMLRHHKKHEKEAPPENKQFISLETEEGVKTFVSSIEDKSKAINAAIGRVYSVRRGGSQQIRKKLKIDAEHYNEFNQLREQEPDKRKITAVRLLNKIKDRLELLQKPEKEVFDKDDLEGLLNLKRDDKGKDKIIDVLINNDKDPIKAYYEGALEFCDNALKQLGEKK